MLQGKTVQFDYQWFACPALRASVLLVTWARPLGRQLSSYEGERPLQPVLQCFWHQNDITRAQLLHNFYMHYWTYSIQPFGCRPQSAVHVVALAVFSGVMDPSWVPLSEFITELLYPGLFSAVWTGLLDLTPFHLRTWSTVFCMNVHSEYIVSSAHQVPIRERHTHTLTIEDKGPSGLHHWKCVCLYLGLGLWHPYISSSVKDITFPHFIYVNIIVISVCSFVLITSQFWPSILSKVFLDLSDFSS